MSKIMLIYLVFFVQVIWIRCLEIGGLDEKEPSEEVAFPWVGTLCLKKDEHGCRFRTGVVMLKKDILMTVSHTTLAHEVVNFKRNESELFLLLANGTINCIFQDYLVHPENDVTSNTLALIHVICPKLSSFNWDPLDWALNENAEELKKQKFLKIEYRNGNTQVNPMKNVNRTFCDEYYRKQELDYKSVTPHHYSCYQELYAENSCVYELGSALVVMINTQWTLLGISTLSPGCTLPSRFINVYKYFSWLEANIGPSEKRVQNPIKMIPLSKRTEDISESGRRFSKDQGRGRFDVYEDQDMLILNPRQRYPVDKALVNRTENHQFGLLPYCRRPKKANIMYKDWSKISAPRNNGRGIYSLTFYDHNFVFIQCIRIAVYGAQKSQTRIYYEKETGFHQEDDADTAKEIKLKTWKDRNQDKIIFLKDTWLHYRRIPTTTIIFEFDFINDAFIAVIIYGSPEPTPVPTTTTATKTKRTRIGTKMKDPGWL